MTGLIRWLAPPLEAARSLDGGARRDAAALAQAAGGHVVVALIADRDGDRRDDGDGAQTDDYSAGGEAQISLVHASRLARRQRRGLGGESRRSNHGRYRDRGNNTFRTKHRLSPGLSEGRILVRSSLPSQPAFP